MPQTIPVDTIHHVTIVTRDAHATAREHSRFFGIPSWSVTDWRPERMTRTSIYGRGRSTANMDAGFSRRTASPGEFGFLSARGTVPSTGLSFEIVQPTAGLSSFEHFLVTRGQGVHSICLSEVSPEQAAALRAFLADKGVPLALGYAINDEADFLYFDTRRQLGGFYLQIIVAHRPDWRDRMDADAVWDFTADLSDDPGALAVRRTKGIAHFGIVVDDVEETMRHYVALFDAPIWRAMNWRTSPWLLEDSQCNGQPVDHSFFAVRADVGRNPLGVSVGFELLQPLEGPSHYKEDFLQRIGPGIHHLDLAFPYESWEEWHAFTRWCVEDADAPCCMSGWLRGRSHLYHYHDAQRTLGYVVEVHAPPPPGVPAKRTPPHYWYDFSVPGNY